MKSVVQTTHLLLKIVELGRLVVRIGCGHEIVLLSLLELGSQLEDLLVLLLLSLVVHRQLAFGFIDVPLDLTAFILAALNVNFDSLNLHVFLVELGFSVHDITVCSGVLLAEICVLALHILKVVLKKFRIACLLLDLLFIVRLQISDAVFHHGLSLAYLSDPELELFVHVVEVGTVLELATI